MGWGGLWPAGLVEWSLLCIIFVGLTRSSAAEMEAAGGSVTAALSKVCCVGCDEV